MNVPEAVWLFEKFLFVVSRKKHCATADCHFVDIRQTVWLSVCLSMCQFVRHTELNSVYLFANGLSHNKSLTAGVSVYVLGFSSSPEAEAAKSFGVGGWLRPVGREVRGSKSLSNLLPPSWNPHGKATVWPPATRQTKSTLQRYPLNVVQISNVLVTFS